MLHLHRAERADRLAHALAAVVADPLDDPLTPEVIAVHSRGVERWLSQELSARLGVSPGRNDGVCANIEFPFPSRVVARGLAVAGGPRHEADPWRPERLVWPLLEVIGSHSSAEWLAPLRAHIAAPAEAEPQRRGRRFSAARHIADLFDRYATHRPAMIRDWVAGREVDGAGSSLNESFLWQPRLWRLVRDRVATPSPAERLPEAVELLRAGADVPDLPPRVSLFGLTALPASYVSVLAALANQRDVHLFLLHPSPVLWRRVDVHRRRPGGHTRPGGRDHDPARLPLLREDDYTREAARHPLLASWGRDARELQLVVTPSVGDFVDDHIPLLGPEPSTLLGLIQAHVRADTPPPGLPLTAHHDPRTLLSPEDRSLQVHACHGRTRQVEALRDAILHLMAEDHTLEPRDVLVMCPDIETFAPIIHAVFGAHALSGEEDMGNEARAISGEVSRRDLPDLRVRLADRAIRQTNPVLRAVAELLTLADGRLTASEVLSLSSRDPVRRRFGFDDEDHHRLEAWVAEARIRWGLDAEHRAAFGLSGVGANTWRAGLERLLVGAAMADEDQRLVGGTAPLDDMEGAEVDLAGRFAEFLDRLAAVLGAFAAPQPLALWRDAIAAAADNLTTASDRDRWQQVQLHRLLDDVVSEATLDGSPSLVELSLSEVRSLLEVRLQGGPSRANHRTGDLTVSTLVPMRSVPHRVICLLGLDDGSFPRRTAPDGDDLIELAPRVGDRDPRTEDRQLLLDALLAATDHLIITYTGRDERTNEPRPPAVPIGELLDLIDRTVRTDEPGVPARAKVLVEHPLQPFDPRNFTVGELISGRPWGFDANALAGATAKARGHIEAQPFLSRPLPREPSETVELSELVRFLEHPVKAFLRRRLGVRLPTAQEQATDRIPVELDSLERYALGHRLLTARLAGVDLTRWLAVERARGTLPPGALAEGLLEELTATVDAILAAAAEYALPDSPRENLEVILPLPGGRTLVGTVPIVSPVPPATEPAAAQVGGIGRAEVGGSRHDLLVTVQYSRVSAKHRLGTWARLLAASAAHPDRGLAAVTMGRSGERGKTVCIARLPLIAPDPEARQRVSLHHLVRLVELYDAGMSEPLPLYCDTSAAYAQALHVGDDEPLTAAAAAWTTGRQRWPNEDLHPEHVLVHGGVVSFESLCGSSPDEHEQGEGWPDESTRFGRYARRLWDDLLALEEIEDR